LDDELSDSIKIYYKQFNSPSISVLEKNKNANRILDLLNQIEGKNIEKAKLYTAILNNYFLTNNWDQYYKISSKFLNYSIQKSGYFTYSSSLPIFWKLPLSFFWLCG
jgi:hypothetical protein